MRSLLISNMSPLPLTNGGNQRTYHLLQALRTMGETDLLLVPRHVGPDARQLAEMRERFGSVEVVAAAHRGSVAPWKWLRPLAPESVDRAAHALGDRGFYYGADAAVSAALRTMMSRHRYDVFVARYAQSAGLSGLVGAASPVLIDIDDLDTHVVESNLADAVGQPLKQWMFRRQLRQLQRALPPILGNAAHCWVTTDGDGASVGSGRFSILPNIPLVGHRVASAPGTEVQRIIMVGAMYFRPNAEGAAFFVEKVWPRVRAAHPKAEFRIIGGGLDEAMASAWRKLPGVSIAGFVESLAPEYAQATMAVVPVLVGGGTKIKVLEALAHGKPCVVSAHAQRGYERDLIHGQSLLVAADAEAFSAHCLDLLGNAQKRSALAEHGQAVVESSYSTARFSEIVRRDVRAVLGSAH